MEEYKLKEILFGTLLGDGRLQTYTGGRTWRVRFLQSSKNKDYLFHLYDVFKRYVKTAPKESWLKTGHGRFSFNTTVNVLWVEFASMFYDKRKKVPDKEYLDKYLTPIALAYWYMDVGSLKSNTKAYYLCTDSFKLSELKAIGEVLKEKYDINISYHKKGSNTCFGTGYRIYIPRRDYETFKGLVEGYIHVSMRYKL